MRPGTSWIIGIILALLLIIFLKGQHAPGTESAQGFARLMLFLPTLVFVIFVAVILYGRRFPDKGLAALHYQCDPEAAIAIFDKKLAEAKAREDNQAWQVYASNLAVAYHANNETDRAIRLLESLRPPTGDAVARTIHHGNLATMHWDKGDYDAFAQEKEQSEAFLKLVNRDHAAYKTCADQIARLDARAAILAGDYTGALTHFQQQLQHIPMFNRYAKVTSLYMMAGIYHLMDNAAERDNCLQYVASHGNKLYIAKVACEQLAQ